MIGLLDEFVRPEFFADAACRPYTPALFYGPGHGENGFDTVRRESRAKAVCARCPVIHECRDHARRHREQGVWGGETESERARAGYWDPTSRRAQMAARRAAS